MQEVRGSTTAVRVLTWWSVEKDPTEIENKLAACPFGTVPYRVVLSGNGGSHKTPHAAVPANELNAP